MVLLPAALEVDSTNQLGTCSTGAVSKPTLATIQADLRTKAVSSKDQLRIKGPSKVVKASSSPREPMPMQSSCYSSFQRGMHVPTHVCSCLCALSHDRYARISYIVSMCARAPRGDAICVCCECVLLTRVIRLSLSDSQNCHS